MRSDKIDIKELRLYATGEPTLHPQLDKIINYLKEKNLPICVSTNCSGLAKYKHSLALVNHLQFSIEGYDKESYEKLRYPLKFEQTIKNLEEFTEYISNLPTKPFRDINLIVTKETDILKFINLWEKYTDAIYIHPMYPMLKFEESQNKFVRIENKDLKIFSLGKMKEKPYCSYPFNSLTIHPDGRIMVCCADFSGSINLGNILTDEIDEILENKNRKMIQDQFKKKEFTVCSECYALYEIESEYIKFVESKLENIEPKIKEKIRIFE